MVEAPVQPTREQNLTAFITPVDDQNITGFYYWFMSEACDCVPEQDQATAAPDMGTVLGTSLADAEGPSSSGEQLHLRGYGTALCARAHIKVRALR